MRYGLALLFTLVAASASAQNGVQITRILPTIRNAPLTSSTPVVISTEGWGNLGAQVSGTWTGQICAEQTLDPALNTTNWVALPGIGSSGTTTANGVWVTGISAAQVRMRFCTPTSGSPVIYLRATLGGGGSGSGGGGGGGGGMALVGFANEELTIPAVSTPLTAATYANATYATMVCKTASAVVNALVDGNTPTTTIGTPINEGDFVQVFGATNISNFRGIRTGGVSAVCAVSYYR